MAVADEHVVKVEDLAPVVDLARMVSPTLEQVRDAAIELVTPALGDLIKKLGKDNTRMMRTGVREHMATLVQRGMFVDSNPDLPGIVWRYVPPTDAGAAARYDRVHKPTRPDSAPSSARGSDSTPSGRSPVQVGNKEVQRIIDAAWKAWGASAVRKMGNNHVAITPPGGDTVRIASTPNQRGLLKDKAKLRKAGLALA
jgi:hypothetical protein